MAIDIRFDALAQPDFAGQYEQGQRRGQAQMVRNALSNYEADPEGAIKALTAAGDVQGASEIRRLRRAEKQDAARAEASALAGAGDYEGAQAKAIGAGDFDAAHSINQLSDDQRQQAAAHAKQLAAFAYSIKKLPYEARKARIQAARAGLVGQGFTPEQLDGFDPTDENVDGVIGQAMTLQEQLSQGNADRSAAMQEKQFGETVRSHKATEAAAGARQGLAETREARVRSNGGRGAGGVSGLPSGFQLD